MTKPTNKTKQRLVKTKTKKTKQVVPAQTASWQRQLLTGALSTAGSFLGPAGASVGQHLGNLIANWRGYGGYNIDRNSLITAPVPAMHSSRESTIIRHREYVADVVSSPTANTFQINTLSVNPGIDTTFPWLSTIAQQFQEYHIKGMVVEYVSTSADALNSVNTALGTVMIASRYRANSAPFVSKQQMLNEYFSCDSKPANSFVHPIECNPRESPSNLLYVRTGATGFANDDLKWYDLCEIDIATTGFQGSSVVCGEIWISYEIELFKPQLSGALALETQYAHYGLTAASAAHYYGTTQQINSDNIGLTFNATQVLFPIGTQGTYLFLWSTVFTSGAGSCATPGLGFTNCTYTVNGLTNLWAAASGVNAFSSATPAGTSTSGMVRAFFVTILSIDQQAIITMSGGTFPSAAYGDLLIMQVPSQIVNGGSL